MRCRKIVEENGIKNIVWFGSYGKNQDGTAKFAGEVTSDVNKQYGYEDNGKHENYSIEEQAICDSITQQLSIIRGELWYNINKGLPIFDKVKRKGFIDSYVVETTLNTKDVKSITSFKSEIENNHHYKANLNVLTKYGELAIEI